MKKLFLLGLLLSTPAYAQSPMSIPWPTTNSSAVIATGNTFQQLLPAVATGGTARRSLTIVNNNTNGDNCWVFVGALASATKATSILLIPGGSYQRYFPYVPSDVIAVTCVTNSDSIYADIQ